MIPKSGNRFSDKIMFKQKCTRGEPSTAIFAAAALLAEPHLLGKLRAGLGVFRRHHWIIGRQAPLLAILLRRHAVARAQVPFERLELVSIFQADDMFGRDRAL